MTDATPPRSSDSADMPGSPEPQGTRRLAWLDTPLDGRSVRFWIAVALLIAAATIGFGAWWEYGRTDEAAAMGGATGHGGDVHLVTWQPEATPRLLGSVAEIEAAASVEPPGIVVDSRSSPGRDAPGDDSLEGGRSHAWFHRP